MRCISPCFRFQIPPIFGKFSDSEENFHNFTFSRKISSFSFAEISDDLFLVIDHKFRISPLFSPIQYISSSVSRKLLLPPYFDKFPPPVLDKLTCFFTYFTCISFPPTLTMTHLCITQCTYWTPLSCKNLQRRTRQDLESANNAPNELSTCKYRLYFTVANRIVIQYIHGNIRS